MDENTRFNQFISGSYARFYETQGARIVPVLMDQERKYYEKMFNKTNGMIMPGGSVNLFLSGKILS